MTNYIKQEISGWGNYPKQVCQVYRPETPEDIQSIIANGNNSQIAYGLGRSYGDTALNPGGVIRTDKLNHLLDFNEETLQLTCEAGVSLAEVIDIFVPRGYFLPVTPGTKFVTIGGAIANDVHGKNHHKDGCFSEFVISFELLTAENEVIICSRDVHTDIFWATIGGIGLTGIILRATIQLMPIETSYIQATYEKATNLSEAMDKFIENDENYTYSVAWIDCLGSGAKLGRSVLMRGEHALLTDLPKKLKDPYELKQKQSIKMPIHAPGIALNRWTIAAFNKAYYAAHKNETKLVDLTSFFHPLDAIGDWNKLYGKKGFIQYQAVFPKANNPHIGLGRLLKRLSKSKRASFLAVLKSSGPKNDGLLSFPVEGYTLALDIPIKNRGLFSFLKELDELVLSHGGRVYLAKDATIDPDTFKQMYPAWEEFLRIKQMVDPNNKFASSMSRRIGLTEYFK